MALALIACQPDTFSGQSDAGDDASGQLDVSVGPTGFCATHAATSLCEDFDEYASIADLTKNWVTAQTTNWSFALVQPADAPSAPNALELRADAGVDGALTRYLNGSRSSVHVSFAIKIGEHPTYAAGDLTGLLTVALGDNLSAARFALYLNGQGLGVVATGAVAGVGADGGPSVISQPLAPQPKALNVWHRVALDWDALGDLTVLLDGTPSATLSKQPVLTTTANAGLTVAVASFNSMAHGNTTVDYDDIVADLTP